MLLFIHGTSHSFGSLAMVTFPLVGALFGVGIEFAQQKKKGRRKLDASRLAGAGAIGAGSGFGIWLAVMGIKQVTSSKKKDKNDRENNGESSKKTKTTQEKNDPQKKVKKSAVDKKGASKNDEQSAMTDQEIESAAKLAIADMKPTDFTNALKHFTDRKQEIPGDITESVLRKARDSDMVPFIQALSNAGVDFNKKTKPYHFYGPLMVANDRPENLKALIAAGAKIESGAGELDATARKVIEKGDSQLLKDLITKADGKKFCGGIESQLLGSAIEHNKIDCLNVLLQEGIMPSAMENGPLITYTFGRQKPVNDAFITALIDAKVPINFIDIGSCVSNNRTDFLVKMLKKDPNYTVAGFGSDGRRRYLPQTILFNVLSAYPSDLELIKALLAAGANPNLLSTCSVKDGGQKRFSCLYPVLMKDHWQTAELLFDAGALLTQAEYLALKKSPDPKKQQFVARMTKYLSVPAE